MKKLLLAACCAGMLGSLAQAGEVKVNWQEPDKYTDIRPGNETRAGFQGRVFKDFDQMFAELAKKLPDGYLWEVTVTDLDLAGEVRPMFARTLNDIRVIKELYWPRMSFSYTLKDPQGKLVVSAKEQIKDMNFMSHVGVYAGYSNFQYEERMLHDWFDKQQKAKVFPGK